MRYGNQAQQNLVNMYSPINTEFYQGLLNQAQGNLTQSAGMQTKFLEDVYGQKYIDKATRDAQVAKAEQAVAGALDKDFVSPSQTIKTISKASQELAPWRNVNEKQLEEAKRQQEQKDRWGSNWIGNDVTTMKLTDPETGQLISPDKLKGIAGNQEDLTNYFQKKFGKLADATNDIPGKWVITANGQLIEQQTQRIKGLTPEQQQQQFGANYDEAVKTMQEIPGFAEAVKASGQDPREYIKNSLNEWSKQLVGGSEIRREHFQNRDYVSPSERQQQDAMRPSPMSPTPGGIFKSEVTPGEQLRQMVGGKETLDYNKMPFNKDGNLMAVKQIEESYLTSTGTVANKVRTEVNTKYKEAAIQLYNYKKLLNANGIKVTSDKEALKKLNEASANSATHYALTNEQVSDRYGNDNFNPFRNPDGGYKDASKTAELEYQDIDGNWKKATEKELADYAGIEGITDTKGIRGQLSTMSDKELDYSGKQTKLRGSIMDKNGNSIPVRVNPSNTKVTKYSEPLLKTKQMLLKAGDSRIFFDDDNIGFTIKTAPKQVFNPQTGQMEIINKITEVIPDKENSRSESYPAVLNILGNPKSDLEGNFLTLAKTYRDNGFVNNQIVYQKEKIK